MVVDVPRAAEHAEEDEARRHRGVQAAQEDDGGNHKGKGHLLVHVVQRAKGRGRHVLVPRVGVDDGADDAEDDDLGNGARPERLGELAARVLVVNHPERSDENKRREERTVGRASRR